MKKARIRIDSNKDGWQKADNHKMERVELHLHTNMSQLDSSTSAREYIRYAYQNAYKAMAITDHGCVQAFPEAMETVERIREEGGEFKIIYGIEAYMSSLNRTPSHTRKDDKKETDVFMPFHMTILVQNQKGLKNLYKLVSWSNQPQYHRYPCITKEKIAQYREGLIIGSGCEDGELFRAIAARKPRKTLVSIASVYDFLEILPSAKKKDNQMIFKLGNLLKIPVCATGNERLEKLLLQKRIR